MFYIREDLYIKHGVRMMMLFMEIHFIYKPLRSEEKKRKQTHAHQYHRANSIIIVEVVIQVINMGSSTITIV